MIQSFPVAHPVRKREEKLLKKQKKKHLPLKIKEWEQTILGNRPGEGKHYQAHREMIAKIVLPKDLRWKGKVGNERAQCQIELYEKSPRVCVKVYGNRTVVERLMHRGHPAICQTELIVRHAIDGRFMELRYYLTSPTRKVTHEVRVVPTPKRRPPYVHTLPEMRGVGVLVRQLK